MFHGAALNDVLLIRPAAHCRGGSDSITAGSGYGVNGELASVLLLPQLLRPGPVGEGVGGVLELVVEGGAGAVGVGVLGVEVEGLGVAGHGLVEFAFADEGEAAGDRRGGAGLWVWRRMAWNEVGNGPRRRP
jgi:hypothetical protein